MSFSFSHQSHILNTLEELSRFSGYKLNLGKSDLLSITTAVSQISSHSLPFKFTNNKFSYLRCAYY